LGGSEFEDPGVSLRSDIEGAKVAEGDTLSLLQSLVDLFEDSFYNLPYGICLSLDWLRYPVYSVPSYQSARS
jgi:hypothetical protein